MRPESSDESAIEHKDFAYRFARRMAVAGIVYESVAFSAYTFLPNIWGENSSALIVAR